MDPSKPKININKKEGGLRLTKFFQTHYYNKLTTSITEYNM